MVILDEWTGIVVLFLIHSILFVVLISRNSKIGAFLTLCDFMADPSSNEHKKVAHQLPISFDLFGEIDLGRPWGR